MAKFKKKPVVINAVQLRWDNWNEICDFANVGKLEDGKPTGVYLDDDNNPLPEGATSGKLGLLIPTLEGVMVAKENDWIISGIKGELYPCRADIFEETYEAVNED